MGNKKKLCPNDIWKVVVCMQVDSDNSSTIESLLSSWSYNTRKKIIKYIEEYLENNIVPDNPTYEDKINISMSILSKYYLCEDIKFYGFNKPIKTVKNSNKLTFEEAQRYAILKHEQRFNFREVYEVYIKEHGMKNHISYDYFRKQITSLFNSIFNDEKALQIAYLQRNYKYGSEVQIDWSGEKFDIIVSDNNISTCNYFVVVWPASGYVYAELVPNQKTETTIYALNRAFKFFERIPSVIVCDNAKSLVTKHNGKDIVINPSFNEYALELDIFIEPAPVKAPKRKSLVEYTVRLLKDRISRSIHELLDKRICLEEINKNLMELVNDYINKASYKQKNILSTRYDLYTKYEKVSARPCPAIMPQFIHIVPFVTVPKSYHILVQDVYYSVPYTYVKQIVSVKILDQYIKVFNINGVEIVSHKRIYKTKNDEFSPIVTCDEHRSQEHRNIIKYELKDFTVAEVINKASELSTILVDALNLISQSGVSNARQRCVYLYRSYIKAPDRNAFECALLFCMGKGVGFINEEEIEDFIKNNPSEPLKENGVVLLDKDDYIETSSKMYNYTNNKEICHVYDENDLFCNVEVINKNKE